MRFGKLAAILLAVIGILSLSAASAEGPANTEVFRSAGSIVTLGRFEQDNNAGNGPEPIEWIILNIEEGRCLLLSRYGLDARPYHGESVSVTWETCSLRAWLNGDFLAESFTEEERAAILLTDIDNSRGQGFAGYGTSGGNTTQDKVFLLSWAEAERFFPGGNLDRLCAATSYAVTRGAWTSRSYLADGLPACAWWLRSPGTEQRDAIRLGNIAFRRDDVSAAYNCVRPALWISLNMDVV